MLHKRVNQRFSRFPINGKKAQIGATLNWVGAVIIILFIMFIFIVLTGWLAKDKSNQIDIFLLICSFIFPVFLFHGFNWEYERLNMMILILYLISFSKIFVDRDKKIVLLLAITLLLIMTGLSGMYASFK